MAINIEAKQSMLEQLLAEQKQLEADITVGKAMLTMRDDLTTAISGVFNNKGVAIETIAGRFLSLEVVDGKLTVDVSEIAPAPSITASRKCSTSGNGKASEFEYTLQDGRKFERVVDAIEALTGKPCDIKHDGKTFPDGKQILRYERLNKELKGKISKVAKAAATKTA